MTRRHHSRINRESLTQRPRPTAPRLLGPSCIGAAELELPCPHKGETRKFFSPTHHPEQDFRDPTSLPTLRRSRETLSLLVAKQRHAATSPNTNIHSSHHQRPAGCHKVTGLISCRRLRGWWAGTASRTRNSTAERQAKSVQASGRSGTPGLTTPRTPLRTPFARARTRDPLRGPSPRAPRGHFLCSTDEGRPVTTSRLGCTGRRW